MPELITRFDPKGEAICFTRPTTEEWEADVEGYSLNVYRLIGAVIAQAVGAAREGDAEAQDFLDEARTWVSARAAAFLGQTYQASPRATPKPKGEYALDRKGRQLGEESISVLRTLETGVAVRLPMNQRNLACIRTKFKDIAMRRGLHAHCHTGNDGQVIAWVTPFAMSRKLRRLPRERLEKGR